MGHFGRQVLKGLAVDDTNRLFMVHQNTKSVSNNVKEQRPSFSIIQIHSMKIHVDQLLFSEVRIQF